MTVRVRYKLSIAVSSSQAEEKDLANQTYEVVTDSLGEGGTVKTTVVAGATNLALQLPQISSASFLAIRTKAKNTTDGPVPLSFTKNSTSGEVFVVAPMAGTKEGHMLFSTSGITSLFVSNTGVVDMELTVVLCGN